MKKLAIFDLDGTLIDSLADLAQACNFSLQKHGLPTHDTQSYRYMVGNGIYKLVERMTPKELQGDKELVTALKADFDAYYEKHQLDFTKPYPGIVDMLDALGEKGVAVSVLSNKPDAFTRFLCQRFFGERMRLARGQRDGWPIKPDPSLVRSILEDTGFTCDDTLYIGDSGVDMQTGKNGGAFTVGVLWGFRDREELLENGADALAQVPADILKYLD